MKKGEKELQMIFALFILLIVTLVVLMLFFKFSSSSSKALEQTGSEYFAQQTKDKAIQSCTSACSEITDQNGLIEFCHKIVSIDWNTDKIVKGKATFGKWDFCEAKIPCFVMVDSCQDGKYDGSMCWSILADSGNNRQDYYDDLYCDPGRDVSLGPACQANSDDSCALPATSANWKKHFCFDQDYATASPVASTGGQCTPSYS